MSEVADVSVPEAASAVETTTMVWIRHAEKLFKTGAPRARRFRFDAPIVRADGQFESAFARVIAAASRWGRERAIVSIVCSPYLRTWQTAKGIAKEFWKHCGASPRIAIDNRLSEHVGLRAGPRSADCVRDPDEFWTPGTVARAGGSLAALPMSGESEDDLAARCVSHVRSDVLAPRGSTLEVVVTHNSVIRGAVGAALAELAGIGVEVDGGTAPQPLHTKELHGAVLAVSRRDGAIVSARVARF